MKVKNLSLLPCLLLLTGCATSLPPLKTVEKVDLKRYMGPWYVIACIPTFIETEAYNAIENYRLEPDGTIDTVFTFNQGSFDGPPKPIPPVTRLSDVTRHLIHMMARFGFGGAEMIASHLALAGFRIAEKTVRNIKRERVVDPAGASPPPRRVLSSKYPSALPPESRRPFPTKNRPALPPRLPITPSRRS